MTVVVLIAIVGITAAAGRAVTAAASALPRASAAAPSTAGASGGVASAAPGGKLAQAMVAALHHDPFIGHVDESIVARSTAKTVTVNVTAKAVGDIVGRDVAIHATGTGAGPATDDDIVTVGDAAWTRSAGAQAWQPHPRTAVAASVDGLLKTIQLIDDPNQLADIGVEQVDGQFLHHLTAAGTIAYRSADGADGAYDTFDVWVTDQGIPVLAKASFSAAQGENAIVGNTDIRYSNIGGAIRISPPAAASSPSP